MAAPKVRHHGGGFSLLEMLVVLAIGTAVLALSLPSLLSGWGARVDLAATAVAGELRRARAEALAGNRTRAVLFDLRERRVSRAGGRPRPLPEDVELELLTARSQRVDTQLAYIRFFADGSATGGRLDFRRDGHLQVAVDVDWLTGAVKVLKPGGGGSSP